MSETEDDAPVGRCEAAMDRVMRAVVRGKWLVLAASLLLTVGAIFACVRFIGISTNTVDMISPDVPFRQHAKAFNAAFPHLDNTILVILDAPTPERANVAAESLAVEAREMASVRDVYAPGTEFLLRHGLLYLDPAALGSLVDRLAAAEPMLATLARAPHLGGVAELLTLATESEADADLAGLDRLLTEMVVSARAQGEGVPRRVSWQSLMDGGEGEAADLPTDSARRFLVIRPQLDYSRLKPASAAIAALRDAGDRLAGRHDGAVRVRLTGEAVIEHEELETVEAGGTLAGGLSLAAVALILGVGFRGPRGVAACLITLLAGLVWTAGLAALTVGTLNLISVAFAVLFVGLGIDFCIHFALRYCEETEVPPETAVLRAGRGVGCAMLLSAVCAALGFLSFLPTDYRGLAELGLIAGLGMFVAVGASLTLLPVLLWIFGARPRPGVAPPARPTRPPWLIRRRRWILSGAVALTAISAVLAPGLRFDFNPMNLRDETAASMRAFADLTAETRTTPYVVNVLAADLDAARELSARFKAHRGFGGAQTLASFVPERQDEKLAILGDATFFLAPILSPPSEDEANPRPDRNEAHTRVTAALEQLAAREDTTGEAASAVLAALNTLGPSADLRELEDRWTGYLPHMLTFLREALSVGPVALSDLPDDLRARWLTPDGQARVTARPPTAIQDNGEIRRFAQTALEVTPRATGAPVTIHMASEAVIGAFIEATAYAAAAVLLLLALTLRRARDVLLSLAPLVLASLLTLATAAVAEIPLNFANVIVLPLLMGLGVSSGIHLVLRARQVGDVATALLSSTPRAVLLSVLTTLASFGTLIVSAHKGMSSMGALLTIAIGYTLLAVLVVLPALLSALSRPARTGEGRR